MPEGGPTKPEGLAPGDSESAPGQSRQPLDAMERAAPSDFDSSIGVSLPGSYANPPVVLSWKNVTLKTKNGNYPILKVCCGGLSG